jgi:RNA polymerase sporulation-specific sigma factor
VRFSTYAVPVILGEIRRLFRDGGTVKVSRSLKELSIRANRERDIFAKQHDREPSIHELAELMDVEYSLLVEAICASAPPLSLTHEEDDGEFDLPVDSPEEALSDSIALRQALDLLDARDRNLIFLRYFQGQTQSKAAAALGMTQVQVSRREKKILQAMREKLM